jgi:hypothetical protein
MNIHTAVLAALTKRPFVPFALRLPITDPAEISISSDRITVTLRLDTISAIEFKPEPPLRTEQGLQPPVRLISDQVPPISREQFDTDLQFNGVRTALAEFHRDMEFAHRYGFTQLEVTKCPEAIRLAEAIERGWFRKIQIGHQNRNAIKNVTKLIAVLDKLQYRYLAEGVVTKRGAEQLAAEWDSAQREQNKLRMRQERARKKRHKIRMQKSRLRKKSEKSLNPGSQDPEPLGG